MVLDDNLKDHRVYWDHPLAYKLTILQVAGDFNLNHQPTTILAFVNNLFCLILSRDTHTVYLKQPLVWALSEAEHSHFKEDTGELEAYPSRSILCPHHSDQDLVSACFCMLACFSRDPHTPLPMARRCLLSTWRGNSSTLCPSWMSKLLTPYLRLCPVTQQWKVISSAFFYLYWSKFLY